MVLDHELLVLDRELGYRCLSADRWGSTVNRLGPEPEIISQELFSIPTKKSPDFMRVCGFGVPLLKCTWQSSQDSNSSKKGPAKLQTLSPHPW